MTNIKQVAKSKLCCGCGTCAGICPTEAINMKIVREGIYEPSVEEGKCTNCSLCVKACPGHSVDFKNLYSEIFGTEPKNKNIGNFVNCYVGHSNNQEIRYNSSSGGMATGLLIFALENGMIDGALVTRMEKGNPTEPESFIARTKKDIIQASKSKYCPVAANVGLRSILREKGRFAVVGLPCHIHGIRKAEKTFKALNSKIVLRIGLLCSHMTSFLGMEFMVRKLGIRLVDVTGIDYRGDGWPGKMTVHLKGGSVKTIPLFGNWKSYWPVYSSFFFTPSRCAMCPDQSAELADISLGDAWLPEFKNEKIGESIIVARTQKGDDLLRLATIAKSISLEQVSVRKVEQSQAVNLTFKKKDLATRLRFLKSLGKQTPKFGLELSSQQSFATPLRTAFVYSGIKASDSRSIELLLMNVPFPLFRAYYGTYKFLSCI